MNKYSLFFLLSLYSLDTTAQVDYGYSRWLIIADSTIVDTTTMQDRNYNDIPIIRKQAYLNGEVFISQEYYDILKPKRITYSLKQCHISLEFYEDGMALNYLVLRLPGDSSQFKTLVFGIEHDITAVQTIYADGKLTFESYWDTFDLKPQAYREYLNGFEHGKSISYYRSGGVKSLGNFINGKIEGNGIDYHENGNVRAIYPHNNGRMHGKVSFFDEFGSLNAYQIYDDNIPGEYIEIK